MWRAEIGYQVKPAYGHALMEHELLFPSVHA